MWGGDTLSSKSSTFPLGTQPGQGSPHLLLTQSGCDRNKHTHTYTEAEKTREKLRGRGGSLFYYPKMQSIEGTYNNKAGQKEPREEAGESGQIGWAALHPVEAAAPVSQSLSNLSLGWGVLVERGGLVACAAPPP